MSNQNEKPVDKNEIQADDQQNENEAENHDANNLLNDCLPSNAKLNLTTDEKEELEDLNDEVNEGEFNNFLKALNEDEAAKNLINQFNNLFQTQNMSDFEKPLNNQFEGFNPNFGEGFDSNNVDDFTDQMLKGMLKKEVIYEPLKDAKSKIEELLDKECKTEEETKKREKDKRIHKLICELLELFDSPGSESKESQEKIMEKFEELHDLGGLPNELMKEGLKEFPGFGMSDKSLPNCKIF